MEPYELVSSRVYKREKGNVYHLFTAKLLASVDQVYHFFRHYYNNDTKIVINDWFTGGQFKYRGYREPECKIGASYSEHKFGNAVDFDVYRKDKRLNPEDVRHMILGHRDQFLYITRMETDVNWVHIDCKATGMKDIYLFKG